MSFNIYYLFWIFLVSIQTFFFIRYYIKSREQQKKWDKKYNMSFEEVDTKMFLVYNDKAYWQEKDLMYRGNYRDGKISMKTIEKVDPFEVKDISVSELFGILDKLKAASN